MSYIEANKAAWEEAFSNRKSNWGDDNHLRLKKGNFEFFDSDMKNELLNMDFRGKTVAQFCCNNGRELLSLVLDGGAEYGFGFDIAENILGQARETAQKAGVKNCEFINCNILEIPESYYGKFDFIFFTIGAICWFEDLTALFEKAGKCLKHGGTLMINDGHPLSNMLAMPSEQDFDPTNLTRFVHSYFRKEPWIGNSGMGYISGEYKSKTFTDFSHTMSDIINGLALNGIKMVKLNEYDYEIGNIGADIYDKKGIPLSYILIAVKN
ncbi:MAG: class I SAM-dependent methyltransferase [Defluviitaleaceae bacterium]|nr:class I SAM-dependent methyltransferase [Defluviitaleaceae bacterium]